MSYIVLDLETVRDRSLPPPEPRRCGAPLFADSPTDVPRRCEAHVGAGACSCCGAPPQNPFLPPPFHRIVSLGYAMVSDAYEVESLGVMLAPLPEDEPRILRSFLSTLSELTPTLVTFAGRQFDVPVLSARAFRFGIPFPWYYASRRGADPRYRYSTEGHLDLMDQLCDMGSSPKSQMDIWARSMGLPGKVGVHGGDVEELFAEGRLSAIVAYNACDVAQETGIFFRFDLLRGRMTPEQYAVAIRKLVDKIGSDERLAGLRSITRDALTGEISGFDFARVVLAKGGVEEALEKEKARVEAGVAHLDPLAPPKVEVVEEKTAKKKGGKRR